MRLRFWMLLLLTMLSACGSASAQPEPRKDELAAASALPTTAVPARQPPTPSQTATTSAPPPTTAELPAAATAAPTSDSATAAPPTVRPNQPTGFFPAGPHHVVWHGLRISYDPEYWVFGLSGPTATTRDGRIGFDSAYLKDPLDRCKLPSRGSECFNAHISFVLYASQGLDPQEWLAQAGKDIAWWMPHYSYLHETSIDGRPALSWSGDGVASAFKTYLLSLDEQILLISGVTDDSLVYDHLHFVTPDPTLTVGSFAMVKPEQPISLWTDPAGGAQVAERPRLYGGALATILAIEGDTAQVRTLDNVTGWVRAASAALSTDVALSEPQARFIATDTVIASVTYTSAIPLRDSPSSMAPENGPPLAPSEEVRVYGISGDWLTVSVGLGENSRSGWVRWFYDGATYLEPTP